MSGSQRISLYVFSLVALALASLGYAIANSHFPGIDTLTLFCFFVILAVLAEIGALILIPYLAAAAGPSLRASLADPQDLLEEGR